MEEKTTLLNVSLQHQEYPGSSPIRSITYRKNFLQLTQEQYEEIMHDLPQKWSNENDKITRFSVFLSPSGDPNYYVGMEKRIFDFKLKDYVKKNYTKEINEEESDILYNFFKNKHTSYYLKSVENFYDDILLAVEEIPITSLKLKQLRDILLRSSDVYMLPDFPISQEERDEWIAYRQELRDFTNQPAWPDDLSNIQIPVSPDVRHQMPIIKEILNVSDKFYHEFGVEAFESKSIELIKNFVSMSAKIEIIDSITKMNIPLFNEGNLTTKQASEKLKSMVNDLSLPDSEEIKDQTLFDQLNSKMEDINRKISDYNLGFTVTDLINDILEKRMLNEQAEQLVGDL